MSEYPRNDRFTHKVSRYERPTNSYRCGRAGLWGKPCSQGPDANGSCRGVAACRPHKNGDRWECRRLGGACKEGPRPDGSCCNTQPPCAPLPSIRRLRGRIAALAFVLSLSVLAIAALVNHAETDSGSGAASVSGEQPVAAISNGSIPVGDAGGSFLGGIPSLTSPGELSDIHLAFTAEQGCNECHVVSADHSGEKPTLLGFSLASLSPHADLQEGCVRCHEFGGPASSPHNQVDLDGELQCQSCHTEHKGRFAELTIISSAQCASCHEKKFTSFKDHVSYGEQFPHRSGGSIVFDHAKHVNFHFEKAKDPSLIPATCTSCHVAEGATNRLKISGFEQSCSGCHQNNIVAAAKSQLDVLELPKLKLKTEADLSMFEQCGAVPGEKFKAAGKGRSTAFQDWLVDANPKQVGNYAAGFCELLQTLSTDNMDGLLAAMRKKSSAAEADLFTGLSPTLLATLSNTWIENERFRPIKNKLPKPVAEFGWFVDSKGGLKYRATDHADRVAMAWIKFAQQLRSDTGDALAVRLADQILAEDGGLGACLKCHIPENQKVVDDEPQWGSAGLEAHHRFKFNHSAHLSFVGAGSAALNAQDTGCAVCHQINPESNYAETVRLTAPGEYTSNFNSIENSTCAQCHNENSIKDDCTLCHQYHEAPVFTQRLSAALGGNNETTQETEENQ